MTKIGFIGAGKMAEAMMSALLTSHEVHADNLTACDIQEDRRTLLRHNLGIHMHAKPGPVIKASDILFLAVKPQSLVEALTPVADAIQSRHLVISIVAGKTTAFLEGLLPAARVIRVMPNLPCVVNASVSAFCLGSRTTGRDGLLATQLLGSFGKVLEIREEQFDAVTALSGSGPAFFAYLMDCMVDAAVGIGMDRDDALRMAEYTMFGTGKMLVEKGMSPSDLIASVSSAKGTTVDGLSVLAASDVRDVLAETVKAAARRSRELSS